jgi:hypothetical protein
MPWRPRFHLSTALLVMLTAGVLLFLNLRSHVQLRFDDPDFYRFGEFVQEGQPVDIVTVPVYCARGWPWIFQSQNCDSIFRIVSPHVNDAAMKKQFDDFPASEDERKSYRAATGFGGRWERGSLIADTASALGLVFFVGILSEAIINRRTNGHAHIIPDQRAPESES